MARLRLTRYRRIATRFLVDTSYPHYGTSGRKEPSLEDSLGVLLSDVAPGKRDPLIGAL